MKTTGLVLLVGLLVLVAAAPSWAQFQIATPDGKSSLKFGLLLQPQAEWIDNAAADHTTQNLYVRRIRLLFGGKIGDNLTFFVDTDSPNLGKAAANGTKNDVNIYIQDAVLSYNFTPKLMLDSGMLLMPISHNAQQGATTLLPVDYGPYTFANSTPLGEKVGRDYGTQLRGYLFDSHLEFRAAVTQGVRGAEAREPFRTTFRVVYYPFDAETGFFYTGTQFGKKRILGIGASYDSQRDYKTESGDVYFDFPMGKGGDALTVQGDYTKFDGGTLVPTLAKQVATLFEASYFIHAWKLGPFVQYSNRNYDLSTLADEKFEQVGAAWWSSGHNFNVKLGVGKLEKTGSKDRNQVLLQAQLFFF
jgi:hypothetical protein